jgi:hypothetical protein
MTDIAKALSTANYNVFQSLSERSLLIIRLATAERMEKEQAKINEKYDGSKAAAIESDILALSEERTVVTSYLGRVESGLKRINDVREQLIAVQTAINAGAGPAFDLAIDTLNSLLGRTSTNSESLLANPTHGTGTWNATTTMVAGGGFSEDVKTNFLGSDYVIELDDGSGLLKYDAVNATLGGVDGVAIAKANIQVTAHDGSDSITITDATTGNSYTGTIKRGGLGLLNAWGYDNLSTPEGKAKAQADLNAAIKLVAQGEKEWIKDQTMLAVMQSSMKAKLDELNADYQKVSTEELDAKQAEIKALKSRFDIFNNSLALTQNNATNLVSQMFMTKSTYEKPSWTEIMGKANGIG